MKTVTIQDLRRRTGALVREAASGETLIVEKDGVAVAELGPLQKRTVGDHFRERERQGYFAKLRKTNSNIDRFISEGRDR